jgi:hypothetical protein
VPRRFDPIPVLLVLCGSGFGKFTTQVERELELGGEKKGRKGGRKEEKGKEKR